MNTSQKTEINDLLNRYFDGLYHSDSGVLRTVFHPELLYVNATSNDHEFLNLEAYMKRIDNRKPPASRGDPRNDVIERITVKEGQIGMVEAQMTMLGRDYNDLLTLIHDGEGWRVLTKVFSYVDKKDL